MRRMAGLDEPEEGWSEQTEFWPRTSWREASLTFQILLASNFQVWPRGGGLFDQDEALVDDIMNMLSAYNYYQREADEARRAEQELKYGGSQGRRPANYPSRIFTIDELTGRKR